MRITTGGAAAPFGDDWSCGIQLGDGEWPGLIAEPLFAADLLPVCAPRLAAPAETSRRPQGPTLLRVAHSPDDWPLWLKAAGVARRQRARTGVSILRPGAAGRGRRARHRHGHPALYRRRPRRRPAGRAVCVEGAEGHALVSGLSQLPHRAARFRRVPALDHSRGGASPPRAARASAMPDEKIATLVIGGGQAGLVMSHRLKQRGLPHLVLERQRIAERWRSERWDGLQFQFPNWSVRLPDFPFPHSDPDAFAGTADIVEFIEAYAAFVAPPIRCGVEVTRLSQRRRRRRLHRRDRGRHDRGGQCRRRHRSLSTHAGAGPVARASGVSGPCQPLPQSRTASAGRGAGGRRRRVGRADRRGIAARRPPRLSLGRKAPPHAAPLPRPRLHLVARRDAHRSHHAGGTWARAPRPRHFRRLWRPHHRFPQLRRRRHDPARAYRGGT